MIKFLRLNLRRPSRVFPHSEKSAGASRINEHMNKLIKLRDPTSPLHVCDMVPYDDIESWLQYAASCKVQVLRVEVPHDWGDAPHARLSRKSVISEQSFLPSQEAVQTCVLVKCWCHIWKSVPSLRIFDDKFIVLAS